MLAVLKAVDYFRTYLDESKFSLHTDHSALKELLTTKEPKGRTARWIRELDQPWAERVRFHSRAPTGEDDWTCGRIVSIATGIGGGLVVDCTGFNW